jgi:hypothetical protein
MVALKNFLIQVMWAFCNKLVDVLRPANNFSRLNIAKEKEEKNRRYYCKRTRREDQTWKISVKLL